jgi:hypothetical protein
VTRLINMGFGVELLGDPNAPLTSDLFILRDDLAASTGFLNEAGEAGRFFASERALSSGYQLHFPKPCDPDELIRAIAALAHKA